MQFPENANMRDEKGGIKKISLPGRREFEEKFIPDNNSACIQNIMYGKEFVTREEALMLIQNISGALLIDGRITVGKKKYCGAL